MTPQDQDTLITALRIQQRAADVGFDWPDAEGPLLKVKEEMAELEEAGKGGKGKRSAVLEEVGDLLFAVVNLARKLDIDPRAALEKANAKFQRRFDAMRRLGEQRGIEVSRASLEMLDELWEDVKAVEGGKEQ